MLNIEVVRDHIKNRLTVAKERVTLKLAKETSPAFEAWLTEFSRKIAEKVQPALIATLRGPFSRTEEGRCVIALYSHHDRHQEDTFRSWEMGMEDFRGE